MQHVTSNLRVLVYDGKSGVPLYPTDIQKNYDIVVTTYAVLQAELRLSDSNQVNADLHCMLVQMSTLFFIQESHATA